MVSSWHLALTYPCLNHTFVITERVFQGSKRICFKSIVNVWMTILFFISYGTKPINRALLKVGRVTETEMPGRRPDYVGLLTDNVIMSSRKLKGIFHISSINLSLIISWVAL